MKRFQIIRPALQDDPNWRPPFWVEVCVMYAGIVGMAVLAFLLLKIFPYVP